MAGTIDINNFVSNFKDIGARANKFNVLVPMAGANLEFMAKASKIPESSLESVDIGYQGRKLKYSGARKFSEFTMTVINDESWDIRRALENWMQQLQGHETIDSTLGSLGTYKDPIAQVNQLNVSGAIIRTYEFVNLFPISVGEISLDWASDEVQEFEVTFKYDYWVVKGSTPISAS
jgi:hypothetical protein